jgi:hypothetical protein
MTEEMNRENGMGRRCECEICAYVSMTMTLEDSAPRNLTQQIRRRKSGGAGITARLIAVVTMLGLVFQSCQSSEWTLTIFYAGGEGYLPGDIGIAQNFPREVAFLKERLEDPAETNAIAIHGGNFVPVDLTLAKISITLFQKAQEIAPWSVCGSGVAEMDGDAYLQTLWKSTGCAALGGDLKPGEFPVSAVAKTKSGKKVGVIQWSARLRPNDRLNPEAEGRAGRALTEIRKTTDAQVVVAGTASREEILRFLTAYPGADLVIVRDPLTPRGREAGTLQKMGRTYVYFSGGPTEGVIELKVTMDGKVAREVTVSEPPRTRDVDSALAEKLSEALRKLTDAYTAGEFRGFKVTDLKYSGALSCRACHTHIYESFLESRHAKAFITLVKTRDEYDPTCLPCHTTGFRTGGFRNSRDTPAFGGVQCEACHGSALDHLRNPKKRLAPPTPGTCLACHTPEWSPGFNPRALWVTGTHLRIHGK